MSLLSTFFGSKQKTSFANAETLLDLITGTAILASNPPDIDPILDPMRAITANLQPGEEPSAANQIILCGVYLKLEDYLTTKEPLRTFTKEELRSRMSDSLTQKIKTHEAKG